MHISKIVLLSLFTLVFACKKSEEITPDSSSSNGVEDHTMHEAASDYIWEQASEVPINLNGTSASTTGKGVSISGQKVKITAPGNYVLKGNLSNGQIIVDDETYGVVRLILNNVTINCSFSSAIFIKNAKKVVVIMPENTKNILTDGTTYTFDDTVNQEPIATIFSKEDLSIYGTGSLDITGNLQDGIASKDGLIIKSGTINITAKDDSVRGKDYLIIRDGIFTVKATTDGLKASEDTDSSLGYLTIDSGAFNIEAGDDAIHAERTLLINSGLINIAKCYEGLEGRIITINNGDIHIKASDDGINTGDGTDARANNANLIFNMNGGYVVVDASGDGIDSNGQINMKGGTVIVHGPTANNNAALDYNGTFNMTVGVLVATGSSGMAQQPSAISTQNSVMVGFTATQAAHTIIRLQNENGTNIITFKPTKNYQSFVYAGPILSKGNFIYI
jgi:hypothetical protein